VNQWKHKSEDFGHAYMTQDMEKEPILQMASDKMIRRYVYDKPFKIRFLVEVNGKGGFNPTERGERGLIWYTDGVKTKKALELGCIAMDQGGNSALALGSTQRYSRYKCMPLWDVAIHGDTHVTL
jgi:hypothetical protein